MLTGRRRGGGEKKACCRKEFARRPRKAKAGKEGTLLMNDERFVRSQFRKEEEEDPSLLPKSPNLGRGEERGEKKATTG